MVHIIGWKVLNNPVHILGVVLFDVSPVLVSVASKTQLLFHKLLTFLQLNFLFYYFDGSEQFTVNLVFKIA